MGIDRDFDNLMDTNVERFSMSKAYVVYLYTGDYFDDHDNIIKNDDWFREWFREQNLQVFVNEDDAKDYADKCNKDLKDKGLYGAGTDKLKYPEWFGLSLDSGGARVIYKEINLHLSKIDLPESDFSE